MGRFLVLRYTEAKLSKPQAVLSGCLEDRLLERCASPTFSCMLSAGWLKVKLFHKYAENTNLSIWTCFQLKTETVTVWKLNEPLSPLHSNTVLKRQFTMRHRNCYNFNCAVRVLYRPRPYYLASWKPFVQSLMSTTFGHNTYTQVIF